MIADFEERCEDAVLYQIDCHLTISVIDNFDTALVKLKSSSRMPSQASFLSLQRANDGSSALLDQPALRSHHPLVLVWQNGLCVELNKPIISRVAVWTAHDIRTIGIALAEAKLTLANLAYNFDRLIFHERHNVKG